MATPVNPLLKQLLSLHRGEPDKVPKGHKTSDQWAKEWGMSRQIALRLIRTGINGGVMKVKRYRVQTGKFIRPVAHYYPAKSEQ